MVMWSALLATWVPLSISNKLLLPRPSKQLLQHQDRASQITDKVRLQEMIAMLFSVR